MTLGALLAADTAALALLVAAPALLAAACWALPAVPARRNTLRAALLAAGPATVATRRQLPGAVMTHWRAFRARRGALGRLGMLYAAPTTAALLAAGRLLPWHVTLRTPTAVALVTCRSRRVWVLTNLARLPGEQHRGAGAPLLQQILDAAAAAGAEVQLTAGSDELVGYYRRAGFAPASGAGPRRRMTRPARLSPSPVSYQSSRSISYRASLDQSGGRVPWTIRPTRCATHAGACRPRFEASSSRSRRRSTSC
jgi:hypothetical protein